MKRLVFAAALSFAASAFADTVQSASTFGVLKIADTTHTNVAVCVPWVAAGTGGPIKVADIVMGSNRETGDVVYYYSGSAFLAWEWDPQNGEWVALSSVKKYGVDVGTAVADQTAGRGGALIIHRENQTSVAKPIYLYGQYASAAAKTVITAGTAAAPVISLIAPPSTTAYDMNAEGHARVSEGTSIGPNDYIQLSGDKKRYQYKDGRWGVYGAVKWNSTTSQWEQLFSEGLTIPAGQGALYVSKGGNPTFTW